MLTFQHRNAIYRSFTTTSPASPPGYNIDKDLTATISLSIGSIPDQPIPDKDGQRLD
jgi:hypothetical protein